MIDEDDDWVGFFWCLYFEVNLGIGILLFGISQVVVLDFFLSFVPSFVLLFVVVCLSRKYVSQVDNHTLFCISFSPRFTDS